MKAVPLSSQNTVEFTPSLPFSQHSRVAVVNGYDIWAVGDSSSVGGSNAQTLIENWNGSSWSIISSPNASSESVSTSVAVVNGDDIWAVGYAIPFQDTTLTENWNGSKWSVVSSPDPGSGAGGLNGVAVVNGNDIWAVGDDQGITYQTLIENYC
jgi:hypothetical protein